VPHQIADKMNLETRIKELQAVHDQQVEDLKVSAGKIADSLSPAAMVKSVLQDVGGSSELRATALDTAIGIGTGFLGRKLYVGGSNNLLKKITGSALQFFLTTLVRNKMPDIRENFHKQEDGEMVKP
jgi:hypothetical protein